MNSNFTMYCRMTCLGGSEKGECPCSGPADCELKDHSNYQHARNEAITRMMRYFWSEFRKGRAERMGQE